MLMCIWLILCMHNLPIRIPFGSLTFPLGGVNAYSAGNVLGSNTLSPEMTTESEVGLNMAFFKNRLSFDVSYYNRNTDKQIFSLAMDLLQAIRHRI